MVEAGAKEVTEEQVVEALETAHAAIKQIVAAIDDLAQGSRQEEADGRQEGNRPRLLPRGRGEGARAADRGDAHPRQARELRDASTRCSRSSSRRFPRAKSSARPKPRHIFKELKEKVLRDEVLDARRPARRPQVRRGPADLDRNRRPAAHPRLGRVHARRDAGARHLHARHRRRRAEDRELRGRDVEELHAPLQLPALLGRRSRRSCAARAAAKSATARSPSARSTPMMPAEEQFPYTVRIVSDILESNGSSSMASVCGGSLAMMDAGVPLKSAGRRHRDGPGDGREDRQVRRALSDIAGAEDHYGDMDFKVAGTADGITALQMDIKVGGITTEIMRKALEQARRGRLHILDKMREALAVAAAEHLGVRAAHRHHPDSGRQDPRRHRTGRQDDPQHHRADRREDRRRRRRPRERRVGRRRRRRRRRSRSSRS